ncbi:MAG: hypothetical protein CMM50_03050 [Rhodospirillaceae bacterium]|nr:hypothetical protein [Rhodospirillaceae bacterium]
MNTLHEDQLGQLLCGYVAASDEAIFVVAAEDDGIEAAPIVYANDGFAATTGYSTDAVMGKPIGDFFVGQEDAASREHFWRLPEAEFAMRAEIEFAGADGTVYGAEITLRPLSRTGSQPRYWLGGLRLLGQTAEMMDEHRTIGRNLLARLPSATLFEDRLVFALAQARRMRHSLALLFIDVDAEAMRTAVGGEAYEYLRQSVALRLALAFREGDSLAQLSESRFAMLSAVGRGLDGARLAEKVLETLEPPFRVGDEAHIVSPVVGIAIAPDDGDGAIDLLKAADSAVAAQKAEGHGGFRFHSEALQAAAGERLSLEGALRRALDQGQFRVHYQPLVEATSGRIVAMEALLRWQHPQDGLLPAERFLNAMQESGLILPIGEWVMRQACADAHRWQDSGHGSIQVSVNLSMQEFRRPDLGPLIGTVLAETGLEADRLQLELPDTVAAGDIERSREILTELNELGVKLSIDISTDNYSFGVVPASALKRLPVHRVKIGRATVGDIDSDTGRAAVAEAAIAMAHSLKIEAVAGGVETQGEVGGLKKRRIDVVQGYLVSRPLPAEEIERLLARDRLL